MHRRLSPRIGDAAAPFAVCCADRVVRDPLVLDQRRRFDQCGRAAGPWPGLSGLSLVSRLGATGLFGPVPMERSLARDAEQSSDLGPARVVVEGFPHRFLNRFAGGFEVCDGPRQEFQVLGLVPRGHRAPQSERGS